MRAGNSVNDPLLDSQNYSWDNTTTTAWSHLSSRYHSLRLIHDPFWQHSMTTVFLACPCCLFTIQPLPITIHESKGASCEPKGTLVRHNSTVWAFENTIYLLIDVRGTDANTLITFISRSASFEEAGNLRYVLFAYPQHCSMKFSSQWNFGRNITRKPRALHSISRREGTLAKSGSLYRRRRQQQSVAPGVHYRGYLHSLKHWH